jgi:hypothetical protein
VTCAPAASWITPSPRQAEARADLILADEPSIEAYAAYFEIQMHRGKVRGLLRTSYLWFTHAGTILTGLGLTHIQ